MQDKSLAFRDWIDNNVRQILKHKEVLRNLKATNDTAQLTKEIAETCFAVGRIVSQEA